MSGGRLPIQELLTVNPAGAPTIRPAEEPVYRLADILALLRTLAARRKRAPEETGQ